MRWKKISDYPEYEVSDTGLIRSLDRTITQMGRFGLMQVTYKGRILKQKINSTGYMQVTVRNQKSGDKTLNIHRIVATAFLGGYFDGAEVNHKDGDKTNNDISNLEWVTSSENKTHAIATGLKPEISYGYESPACKGIVEVLDLLGNVVDTFAGEKACRDKGYTPAGVSACINGKQNTHRGFKFRWRE